MRQRFGSVTINGSMPAKQPNAGPFEVLPVLGNMEKIAVGGAVHLARDFGETGLQVIVKLANIQLTPEKPEYAGGTSWAR